MATPQGFRTVNVTTSSANYELMTDASIKASISERLSLTSEQYDALISSDGSGINNMNIQILGSGFNVSINNETFQPLFDDSIYSTGDFTRRGIKSIRVSTDATALQFRFNIL